MNRSRLILGIGVVAVLCFFFFLLINSHPVSIRNKLFDCTNTTFTTHIRLNGMWHSHLMLAVPKQPYGRKAVCPTFAGVVVIKCEGAELARVSIGSESVTACNWLDEEGLQGFLIAWKDVQAGKLLRSALKGKGTHEITMSFSNLPPPSSSIWISCTSRPQWPGQRRVVILNPPER